MKRSAKNSKTKDILGHWKWSTCCCCFQPARWFQADSQVLFESIFCLSKWVWFPRNVRLYLFRRTGGKTICAGLTESIVDFPEYCGVHFPLGWVLDVAIPQSALKFIERGRYSAGVIIDLDVRNSQISWTILFSSELFVPPILIKYARAVILSFCRWTVFASVNFFVSFNFRELICSCFS